VSVSRLIICSLYLLAIASTDARDPATGVMEGHLRIFSFNEVELAKNGTPEKVASGMYADYPLVIRSHDGGTETARINADDDGNYRIGLPPGNYVLDLAGRRRQRARAAPQSFTVRSNQTVRVNLEIDTGVR
jgi:hypothetical protein